MIQYKLEYPASDQKPVKRISAYSGPFNMHAILRMVLMHAAGLPAEPHKST
jgi:hypothetical protein